MANFSRHNKTLSAWTGSRDALDRIDAENEMLTKASQLKTQNIQLQQQQMEADTKEAEDIFEKAKVVIASSPAIKNNVMTAWAGFIEDGKLEIKQNYNGDTTSWFNSAGKAQLDSLIGSIEQEISPALQKSVMDYLGTATNEKTRHLLTDTDKQNFEDLQSGLASTFSFRGQRNELKAPTQKDIETYGDAAYLYSGNNRQLAKADFIMEYGKSMTYEPTEQELMSYVNSYYGPKMVGPGGDVQSVSPTKRMSMSYHINKGLGGMSEMTVQDIGNIENSDGFKMFDTVMKTLPLQNSNIGQHGKDKYSTMIGRGVASNHTKETIWKTVFDKFYQSPSKKDGIVIPGQVMLQSTDGLTSFDANGEILDAGQFVNGVANNIFLGYTVDVVDDNGDIKKVLLNEDNAEEYQNKVMTPTLVAEIIGDVNGTEDNSWFFGRSDETTAVYKTIDTSSMEFSSRFDKVQGLNRQALNIQKISQQEGDIIQTKNGFKSMLNVLETNNIESLINEAGFIEQADSIVDIFSGPLDESLASIGLQDIHPQNKSALLADIYLDGMRILDEADKMGDDQAVENLFASMFMEIPNIINNNPQLKKSLLSNNPNDFYTINYGEGEDNKTMIATKNYAHLLKDSYIRTYNKQ